MATAVIFDPAAELARLAERETGVRRLWTLAVIRRIRELESALARAAVRLPGEDGGGGER
jgi:hypothetical protein